MTTLPAAVETFIERMGLSAQADGLPRIAGRMLGYFIIYGGPCSLASLAGNLEVSRASVSTNARVLRDLGVLEATAVPGDRQDYYRLADQHCLRMLEGYVERMGVMRNNLAAAQRDLPKGWPEAKARLSDTHAFIDVASDNFRHIIDRLQRRPAARKNGSTKT